MTTASANTKAIPRTAPPRPAAAPQTAVSIKDIWGIVRRHVWLIVIIMSLCVVMSVGGFFLMRMYAPKYTAEGFIDVKMPVRPNLLANIQPTLNERILEQEANKQAGYIHSDGFLTQVLQRMKIQDTQWYTSRNDNQRLEDLRKYFSASPVRDTPTVLVRMTCQSSAEAKMILDEILFEFESQISASATFDLDRNRKALIDEQTSIENSVRQKQNQLPAYATIAPGYEQGKSVKLEELRLLDTERVRLEALLFENNSQLKQLQAQGGMSANVMAYVERDPTINGIQSRLTGLKEEMDKLLESQGEQHQEVRGLQGRIQSLQSQMEERRNQITGQSSEYERKNLELAIKQLQDRLTDITERIKNARDEQTLIDQQMATYRQLQDEIQFLQQRLRPLQEEISNANLLRNDIKSMLPEVKGRPIEPMEVSSPKITLYLPAGIMLGLILSLGLAFLLEMLNDSLRSPVDVVRHLAAPSLGMIPLYEQESEGDAVTVETITATRPHALISEYFRQFATDLAFSAPQGELKTILITSAAADCGKTAIAANLGITLATEGKKVLLVDANFRRPRLHKLFPADTAGQRKGLSNLLVGQALVQEAIRGTMIPGLEVVDSGPLPPNPAHLLNSEPMLNFLARQRENYHYVIIDGPPALLVTDARILAAQVDGTVIIVRADETSRGVVQRLLRELRGPQNRVLGVLLNAVRPRRGGYYRKNYQSYYDYIGAAAEAEAHGTTAKEEVAAAK